MHCNSLDAPDLLLFKPILFPRTKIIHTIHGIEQYKDVPRWKIILRNSLCDKFIAISNCVKDDLIGSGVKKDKLITVYNAINLTKFQNHNKKMFDKDYVIVGNVARFIPEKKGQDILIEAIKILQKDYPNIVCRFAGTYDNEHETVYKKYINEIKKDGLSKNINFLGNIGDIPAFLKGIDIFVLPSRYEGFGISLIEAMSMGIPCVASNLYGPAEIIGNNERGELFQAENVNELVEKIRHIIENYVAYQEKQVEIKKYVCENFDICKMSEKLLKIYRGEE